MDWGTYELVDPRLIVIDHRYQREPKSTLIAAIASNPIPEAFGVPVCFRRNTVLYCADGQQRIAGMLASASPPRVIPVVWFSVQGVEHEAEMFVRINEYRKGLTPLEKHTGKVVAKEPAALAISRAVEKVGFTIATNTSSRAVGAVAALNHVYNLIGEDGVEQTLVVLRDAFPDDRKALDSNLIRTVGQIIGERRANGGYERSKLTSALGRTAPAAIFRKAEEIHFQQGTSKRESIRRAIKVLAKV